MEQRVIVQWWTWAVVQWQSWIIETMVVVPWWIWVVDHGAVGSGTVVDLNHGAVVQWQSWIMEQWVVVQWFSGHGTLDETMEDQVAMEE